MSADRAQAEWRDASAYASLLLADRSVHAWEWLRRDPAYRRAAGAALAQVRPRGGLRPQKWGLEAFEDPDLPAPAARPLWSREAHAGVLLAVAVGRASPADAFDLSSLAGLATIVRSADTEHVLLSDGLRTIRIDILGDSAAAGPVELRYLLAGVASVAKPVLTLQRLLVLSRTGRFGRVLHRPEPRARRWLLMLRAVDALAAGADQREIAACLLSRSADGPRWRTEAPSLRSQVQRLVRGARRLTAGGYRELLR